jgi:hypothetical protein
MAIKTRATLYSIFREGAIPTQNDYKDLIDSALIRRDDQFFGRWRKGTRYCPGDVVIHDKSLYQLFVEAEEDCKPLSDNDGDDCYCSTIPPPEDKANWCLLELAINDKDFVIIEDEDGFVTLIYQLDALVGIGTDQPGARFEVSDHSENGRILLEPDEEGKPALTLINLHECAETGRVQQTMGRRSDWTTDGLGYAFWRRPAEEATAWSVQQSAAKKPLPPEEPPVLMLITSDERLRPQVGIGTEAPKGALDAHEAGRGHVIAHPGSTPEPGLLLVSLNPLGNGCYCLAGVAEDHAFITTDAGRGLRFKRGLDLSAQTGKTLAAGQSLMSILPDGKVGIGTETPQSHLEVNNGKSGAVRLHLDLDNPALSVLNLRPATAHPNTYMAIGPDDEHAILITDAPSGFVFKKGRPFGKFDNEVNINQGDKVAYVTPAGRVGVRTPAPPDDYDLDVSGLVRALGLFLHTDGSTIDRTGGLEEEKVLEKLAKLVPIKFKWKSHTNAANEGEQIGFNAQNVFECFPELVKKTGNNKAVAYANLTAVLVQAINEQQRLIKDMDRRICDLEERLSRIK